MSKTISLSLFLLCQLSIINKANGAILNMTSKRCLDIQFDKGNCTLPTTRWSFSHSLAKCIPFPGCPREGYNSFRSLEECQAECLFAECFLEPKFGLCDGAVNNWYYNAVTGLCSQFPTTTCGLNGNRFPTEKLCYESCYQAGCTLYPDFGDCGNVPPTNISLDQRWFMNVTSGLCEPFVYASCGAKMNGNVNNFRTQEDCHNICYCNGTNSDERHVLKAVCKVLPPHPYISRTTDVIGETKFFTEFPKVEDETNLPLQNHAELLPLPDLWQPATTETSTRSAVTTSPMPLPDDFVPITSTTKQLRTTAETTVTILTPSEIVVKTVTTAAIDPIEKMMEYHQQLYVSKPPEEFSAAYQATLRSNSQLQPATTTLRSFVKSSGSTIDHLTASSLTVTILLSSIFLLLTS